MDRFEPFVSFTVALGAGLLIGLQREQSAAAEKRPEGGTSGGIRTFPIVSLAGGLTMLLAGQLSPWIFPAGFVIVMAPIVVAYVVEVKSGGDRGVTTEAAFAVTFLLGGMALCSTLAIPPSQRLLGVGALAVTVATLLSLKQPLHALASRVSREDFYSTLKFLVLAVIILPLLPNREMGPLKVINPFSIGLLVVLLAGVGFVAYVAIRLLGPDQGMGVTGLVGGLLSSTAVTLTVSGRARKAPTLAVPGALAIVLASTVMVFRMTLLLAAISRPLLVKSAGMLAAMAVAGAIASLVLFLKSRHVEAPQREAVPFRNPFELGQAVKFGLAFVVVLFASKAATHYLGGAGAYLAAAVGGLADVDAVTLSVGRLAGSAVALEAARWALLIGAASNNLVKSTMSLILGGWPIGGRVLAGLMLPVAAGAAVALFLPY